MKDKDKLDELLGPPLRRAGQGPVEFQPREKGTGFIPGSIVSWRACQGTQMDPVRESTNHVLSKVKL